MRRVVGMDIHRTFAEVVFWRGAFAPAWRVDMTRLRLKGCYVPLCVFRGRDLLAAKLRCCNIDASAGAAQEVARIVGQIRKSWPRVETVLRADSGFARDEIMA
jgi:hypothetical protein